jgi:hypothetical protein
MLTHVKVLGILLIVLSAFGVLAALLLMLIFGGAVGVVGAAADSPDAAIAIPIIGAVGIGLVIFLLALSLPGLIAGFGLLSLKPWARTLGIVVSALNLIHIPVGTILGAYGLWVLLSKETEQLFAAPQTAAHL